MSHIVIALECVLNSSESETSATINGWNVFEEWMRPRKAVTP